MMQHQHRASHLKRELARQLKTEEIEHMTIEIEFGEDDCRLVMEEVGPKERKNEPNTTSHS